MQNGRIKALYKEAKMDIRTIQLALIDCSEAMKGMHERAGMIEAVLLELGKGLENEDINQ